MFEGLMPNIKFDPEQFSKVSEFAGKLVEFTSVFVDKDAPEGPKQHMEEELARLGNVVGRGAAKGAMSSLVDTIRNFVESVIKEHGPLVLGVISGVIVAYLVVRSSSWRTFGLAVIS